MYRIGKKKKLALLTEDGLEVVVFNKGQETLAEKVCHLLNEDEHKTKLSKTIYTHWDKSTTSV